MSNSLEEFTRERIAAVSLFYTLQMLPCPQTILTAVANMDGRNRKNLSQIISPLHFSDILAQRVVQDVLYAEQNAAELSQIHSL